MAPRANWKGYLRLSLVSCPIALYPASSLSEKDRDGVMGRWWQQPPRVAARARAGTVLFHRPASANGMVRPCSCPAGDKLARGALTRSAQCAQQQHRM